MINRAVVSWRDVNSNTTIDFFVGRNSEHYAYAHKRFADTDIRFKKEKSRIKVQYS